MEEEKIITALNEQWSDIYYDLHYSYDEPISHQMIRILQYIDKKGKLRSAMWPSTFGFPTTPLRSM